MKVRVYAHITETATLITYEKRVAPELSRKIIEKLRELFPGKQIVLTPRVMKPFQVLTINIVEEA